MTREADIHAETLLLIAERLRGLQFGRIVIVVHQGQVEDIDVTERIRMRSRTREAKAPTVRSRK